MGLEAYEAINVSILFFMRTEQIFSNFVLLIFSVFEVVFDRDMPDKHMHTLHI